MQKRDPSGAHLEPSGSDQGADLKKNGPGVILLAMMTTLAVTACAQAPPSPAAPASVLPLAQPITAPSPVGDIVPTPGNAAAWDELRRQVKEARQVAEGVLSVFPQNKPENYLTLSTFYRPHALGESEKDKFLAIAQAWEPLKRVAASPAVVKTEVRDYLWKSFSNESAVIVSDTLLASRGVSQKLLDYMGFDVLPGVFILFHTAHDSYAYAMAKIIVSPAAGKVVYVDAGVTASEPPAAGGWDNVNPDSFRLDFVEGAQNPLSPNYDPNRVYGQEGTRFGPPWDRTPNLIGAASPTGGALPSSSPDATMNYASMVAFLRAEGMTVLDGGPISQSFLSVEGTKARVNGSLIQVFEYGTPEAARADAQTVQPDGSTFKRDNQLISVDWIGPPHFFRSGRIIVLYIGQDEAALKLLQQQLGNQFAGR